MIRISLKNAKAPDRIRLFRFGENHTRKGVFIVDDAAIEAILAYQREHDAKVAIDYDHGTTQSRPVDPSLSGKAAGRGTIIVDAKKDVWLDAIKWTVAANQSIEAEEWLYVSPTFLADQDKRVNAIISVALTNVPATDSPMPLIELKGAPMADVEIEIKPSEEAQEESAPEVEELAEWTTEFVNDLPDSAFLLVEDGDKDESGRTVPRTKRHFPVFDSEGKLDLPHLRNAIARIPQAKIEGLDEAAMAALQEKARKMLEEAQAESEPMEEVEAQSEPESMGCKSEEKLSIEAPIAEEQVELKQDVPAFVSLAQAKDETEALEIIASWKGAFEKLSQVESELVTLKGQYSELERQTLLERNATKIPGKLREWALKQSTETLKDFFANAPEVVPSALIPQPKVEKQVVLNEEEKALAKAIGLSEDKALAYKMRISQ